MHADGHTDQQTSACGSSCDQGFAHVSFFTLNLVMSHNYIYSYLSVMPKHSRGEATKRAHRCAVRGFNKKNAPKKV
jgi:hypothetical protein